MITITYEKFLAMCAGFSVVCVAVGWLIKIIKALKKPNDDINEKLDNDNKRLKKLEGEMDYLTKSISVLMRCDLAILGHLRTNNNTGQLAKVEDEIQNFLLDR